MKKHPFRQSLMALTTIAATGCVTVPGTPTDDLANKFRETFASADPCSNNARNIGVGAGVIAGLVLGKAAGEGDKGMAIGALLGGAIGRLIGADIDRKRCELSKIAKQYDLEITLTSVVDPTTAAPPVAATATSAVAGSPAAETVAPNQLQVVGSTLTIRSKDIEGGQFESDSDRLTPKAKEYFSAIAYQYGTQSMLGDKPDAQTRNTVNQQVAQRKMFLIGHTDDTGSSQLNVGLSERRAKAVASFLKQSGIPEQSIYFQGAGDTIPIADNRTELGRAANRRVELVEIANEASFKRYLEARKPKYEFYRPNKESDSSTGASNAASSTPIGKQQPSTASATAALIARPSINFGGVPYSPQEATLNVEKPSAEKSTFSFFSKAYASDNSVLADCTLDRPRLGGSVKSLRDGATYKTSEHLPQLFGRTWAADVNGHLVVINRLAVLRDGAVPANLPELKVYALYQPSAAKSPDINEKPQVNSYLVGQNVLYRMFARGDAGLKCLDVLLPIDGTTQAKGGKLIYGVGANNFVANFKPQLSQN